MKPSRIVSPIKPIRLSSDGNKNSEVTSYSEALDYYKYSSRPDNPQSEVLIGQILYYGSDGGEPDMFGAFEHFQIASKFGSGLAKAFLGQMHLRGEGVQVDYLKAYSYFKEAAKKPLAIAYNGLGLMYWKGLGLKKDIYAAENFFQKAVDLVFPEAYYNLAMVQSELSPILNYEKIFQNLMSAVRNGIFFDLFILIILKYPILGYVTAGVELAKRYLNDEKTCNISVYVMKN